jgi:hypothetical protein
LRLSSARPWIPYSTKDQDVSPYVFAAFGPF